VPEDKAVAKGHKPSRMERVMVALKSFRGGQAGPWWTKLLTWVPLLALVSWVLYSWNQHTRQLRAARDELDKIQRVKETREYEARQARNRLEGKRLERQVEVLRIHEKVLEVKIADLEDLVEETAAIVARVESWDDLDAFWAD